MGCPQIPEETHSKTEMVWLDYNNYLVLQSALFCFVNKNEHEKCYSKQPPETLFNWQCI